MRPILSGHGTRPFPAHKATVRNVSPAANERDGAGQTGRSPMTSSQRCWAPTLTVSRARPAPNCSGLTRLRSAGSGEHEQIGSVRHGGGRAGPSCRSGSRLAGSPAAASAVGVVNRTILDHDQLLPAGHPDHGPESVEKRVAKPACLTIQQALVSSTVPDVTPARCHRRLPRRHWPARHAPVRRAGCPPCPAAPEHRHRCGDSAARRGRRPGRAPGR